MSRKTTLRKITRALRTSILILTLINTSTSASAAQICSDLILESQEGEPLLRKFEAELKKEIFPQLKKLGWKSHDFAVSVQNMPTLRRIAPHYMIRIGLNPIRPGADAAVLRNMRVQTPLRINTYPTEDRTACDLVLQGLGDEHLVNQHDVSMPIYIPHIVARIRVPLNETATFGPPTKQEGAPKTEAPSRPI